MPPEIAARLRALSIEAVEAGGRWLLVRGECLALADLATGESGLGATGLLTPSGLAYLVWREGAAYLAGKGGESPATAEQVEAVRRFSADVKSALA